MTDSPITRPGELAKIKALAGDDPYRVKVLVQLAILTDHSEQSRNWQKDTDQWRADHDTNDKLRFQSVETAINDLKLKYTGVSSGVNDYNDSKAQVTGARKLLVGIVAVIAAVGGFVYFMLDVIKAMRP